MMYEQKLHDFNQRLHWKTETLSAVWGLDDITPEDSYLLDYGCGIGIPDYLLASQLERFGSYDPHVEQNPYNNHHGKWRDRTQIPDQFLDNCHGVLLNHSLAHIEDLSDFFSWMAYALPLGHKVCVITPNDTFYTIRKPFMSPDEYASDPTVHHVFTMKTLIKLFEDNGYRLHSNAYRGDKAHKWLPKNTSARLFAYFQKGYL